MSQNFLVFVVVANKKKKKNLKPPKGSCEVKDESRRVGEWVESWSKGFDAVSRVKRRKQAKTKMQGGKVSSEKKKIAH